MPLDIAKYDWLDLVASPMGPADPSERLVLLILSLHMNQAGCNAFPSQELIAKRAGLSVRTVQYRLKSAERGGWIRRSKRPRPGKSWYVHEYVAVIPDSLEQLQKIKPWDENPAWRRDIETSRPADSAGCSKASGHNPQIKPIDPQSASSGPATCDATTCTPLRTNKPNKVSEKIPHERVALHASRGCQTSKSVSDFLATSPQQNIGRPQAREITEKPDPGSRIRALLKIIEFSNGSDKQIAKIANADVALVRNIRSEKPK